jgi:ankyrin repeat protein
MNIKPDSKIDDEDDEVVEFFDSKTELPPIEVANSNDTEKNNNSKLVSLSTPTRTFKPIYALNSAGSNSKNPPKSRIFINKETAMKHLKQDIDIRFKVCKTFSEAYAFSYESEIELGRAPTIEQVLSTLSPSNSEVSLKSVGICRTNSTNSDVEKLPFSAPKKAEINHFRSLVENDSFEQFYDIVMSNPRYLISAGDSPVVVQEAFRYNILHACAKSNRPKICEQILKLLNSPRFMQKLYKNDTIDQSKARSSHLLDLYLNMPEKGLSETALHFACKFGSYEVVKLLISYDICCKSALNKNGKTPLDVICAHQSSSKDQLEAIKSLFEDNLYVQFYRDNERGNVKIEKPCRKLSKSLTPLQDIDVINNLNKLDRLNSSPLSQNSIFSSGLGPKLAGYFGPLSPTVALDVYKRLETRHSLLKQSPHERLNILRGDDLKGYERIARDATEDLNVSFHESWTFLDGFYDLKSRQGLEKLEIYLKQKLFMTILESQLNTVKEMLTIHDEMSEMALELKNFAQIIDLVKKKFALKETYVLSKKFDFFFKLMQSHLTKSTVNSNSVSLPISFKALILNIKETELDEEEENNEEASFYEYLVNDLLLRYVRNIIDLSRLDKTGKCHLNLYKPSKSLLELVNCQRLFENIYLTPAFRRTIAPFVLRNAQRFDIKSRLSYEEVEVEVEDEEEEEETKEKRYNSQPIDEPETIENEEFDDAEMSFLDPGLPATTATTNQQRDDIADILTQKMSAISLDTSATQIRSKNVNNPFSLMPAANNMPAAKNLFTQKKQRLFMDGDAPSKMDRAVFLTIKDVCIENQSKFNLLSEWLDYMKFCNPDEMQQWKTPKKPTMFSRPSR